MKYYFYFISLLIFSSCIKEYGTNYSAKLINNTQHNIKILVYRAGVVLPSDTIKLLPNKEFEIGFGSMRGINGNAGFSSIFMESDSIIVYFDDAHPILHYTNTPSNLSSKYYLYSSKRNLFNYLSYDYSYIDDSKYRRTNYYKYNFTEQDYLDAK